VHTSANKFAKNRIYIYIFQPPLKTTQHYLVKMIAIWAVCEQNGSKISIHIV